MSAEAKHTPGPWYYDGQMIRSKEAGITVAEYSGHLSDGTLWGNRNLICAAPDLLAAARGLLTEIQHCVDDGSLSEDAVNRNQVVLLARAAIKRAEGKEASR